MTSNSAVSTTTPISIKPASAPTSSTSASSVGSAGVVASRQSRKRRRQNHDDEEATGDEQPAPKKPAHHTCSDLRARIAPRVPSKDIKKPSAPIFPDLFGGITPHTPPKIIKKMVTVTKEEASRLKRSRNVTARSRDSTTHSRPAGTSSRYTPARLISAPSVPTHSVSKRPTSIRPTPSSSIKKPALKCQVPKDDEDDEKIIVHNPRPRSKAALKVKALLEDSDDDLITITKPTSSKSTKLISTKSTKSQICPVATTGDEKDVDYQYALGLHAELNGIRSRRKRR